MPPKSFNSVIPSKKRRGAADMAYQSLTYNVSQGTKAKGRGALSKWPFAYKISLHIFHLPRPCPAEVALKTGALQFSYFLWSGLVMLHYYTTCKSTNMKPSNATLSLIGHWSKTCDTTCIAVLRHYLEQVEWSFLITLFSLL
jgi:hypothetical protein